MRKIYLVLCTIAFSFCFYACQKSIQDQANNQTDELLGSPASLATPCGTPLNVTIVNFDDVVVGNLTVSNDASNYSFDISETLADYKIEEVRWIYGTEAHVKSALLGLISCAFQIPATADQTTTYNPGQDQVSLSVPIASFTENCIFFHAHIRLVKRDPT